MQPIGDQVGLIVVNTKTGERGVGGCVSQSLIDAGLTPVLVHPQDGIVRMVVWARSGKQLRSFDWVADQREVATEDVGFEISVHTVMDVSEAHAGTPSEAQIVALVAEALASDTTTITLVDDDLFEPM